MSNQKLIERYILGKLNPGRIDSLWIKFLKDQELFDCFMIELNLRHMGSGKANSKLRKQNGNY